MRREREIIRQDRMFRWQLIEKMCEAHWDNTYTFGCWPKTTDEHKRDYRNGMSAALDVAVEEISEYCAERGHVYVSKDLRSHYLKPKNAERRVTIEPAGGGEHSIWLDGKRFSNVQFYYYSDAECFRRGLISQLKKRASGEPEDRREDD